MTRGPEYLASGIFMLKMLLVFVGVVLTVVVRQRVRALASSSGTLSDDGVARVMSLVATLAWFGAVITGRLIAYLSDLYR
jgi:hypothetical protein